jgi:uncharacterized protein (TIGR02646 family)
LRKINKSAVPPVSFSNYVSSNPNAKWKTFRRKKLKYKELKFRIFEDQGWICGYCETSIDRNDSERQVIEHFHDRSDSSSSHNWDLDWNNIIGVCNGGKDVNSIRYPRATNLSCDSHKNKAKLQGLITDTPEGEILDPLEVPKFPCLFDFVPHTGELRANVSACSHVEVRKNNFCTVTDLVENTIKILNLNCSRLSDDRKKVFDSYQLLLSSARREGNLEIKEQLAKRWFDGVVTSFYTTRRILLGAVAEKSIGK